MGFIDTHAHLDFSDDPQIWINNAKNAGVSKIVCVGTSIEASKKCVETAIKYSSGDIQNYASAGIHPEDGKEDIKKFGENYILELEKVAQFSKKVVAIGECGLDFHLEGGSRPVTVEDDKEFQRQLFKKHVDLAKELDLPLIVHCRNGWEEIFQLLSIGYRQSTLRGVFHSWTGDLEAAKKAIGIGFYISFSGILTFKNAGVIADVAKWVPIDKVVLETDSPFLSPEPLRGRQNEPKNVKIVAEFLAELRGESPSKIEEITTLNALELFGLD